jgi:hypothetical protein
MDDVAVNFLRHIAGHYDRVLGQLCSRCGTVLDEGGPLIARLRPKGGFPPGSTVLVSIGGSILALESVLDDDRDRSDEAECESIA